MELEEDVRFRTDMKQIGATSPDTACEESRLPSMTHRRFQALLDRGLLREAAPGSYYLYEGSRGATTYAEYDDSAVEPPGPRRLVRMLVFWIAVILIPVIFLRFGR